MLIFQRIEVLFVFDSNKMNSTENITVVQGDAEYTNTEFIMTFVYCCIIQDE